MKYRIGVFFRRQSHASREQVAGIFRFAGDHPEWEVHLFERTANPSEYRKLVKVFKPDGILTGHPEVISIFRRYARRHIPGVVLDFHGRRGLADATVTCDEYAIGRKAADFFLSRAFTSFAFAGLEGKGAGDTPIVRSQMHADGFRTRLREAGYSPAMYSEPLSRFVCHYSNLDRLAKFLSALPKPCAVFATSDMIAQSVIFAARRADIAVPERLTVLGVDNEPTVCENTIPTLSSVAPDYIGAGFRAAEMLARMLETGDGAEHLTYDVLNVVGRMSTQNVAGANRRLAYARELIRTKALTPIRPSDIAAEVGVSPRILEIAFQRAYGHTVRDELIDLRLAEAKRLLRETKLQLSEIAEHCGFRTFAALRSLFEKREGLTMRTYRLS